MSTHRFRVIEGSVCAPRGFRAAAVFCDIKKLGTGKGSEKGRKDDLALIMSDTNAAVAGMFTTNKVCAAPVKWSAQIAAKNFARAIVVNSGNANACTGTQGMRDAKAMARQAAAALAAVYDRREEPDSAVTDRRYKKISASDVLVCSTGRIGVAMPMENIARGIRACAPLLARSTKNASAAAQAIMTSDTRPKEIAVEFKIGSAVIRIGGMCKGAGMIAPQMSASLHATMLGFITTDVAISPALLKRALAAAVAQSFNVISVDGDMSTNDTVLALANGAAENSPLGRATLRGVGRLDRVSPYRGFEIFQAALNYTCLRLAHMIVRDGEGVTRFVTLRVNGARNAADADAVARSIANSTLVRTSWHGGDPNWGRVLCAIGYSQARVCERKVDVGYSTPGSRKIVFGFRRGKPTDVPIMTLAKIVSGTHFDLHVNLRAGSASTKFYASDLTEDYVSFNKGDMSDPSSLGG